MKTTENNNAKLIEYDVGEVCKCYYSEVVKNKSEKIAHQINKCQSYCVILSKNNDDDKPYTVFLFDGEKTVKKLPGRCLRKTTVTPFGIEDAESILGRRIRTKSADGNSIVMIISAVSNDNGTVHINEFTAEEIMKDFVFCDTEAPCGRIKMLSAEDVFAE